MLWMAGFGVMLTQTASAFESEAGWPRVFELTTKLSECAVFGAALASLPVAASRLLLRRPGFPGYDPGHWLLVTLGIGVLLWIGDSQLTLFAKQFGDHIPRMIWFWSATRGPISIALLLLLLIGSRRLAADEFLWRWALSLAVYTELTTLLMLLAVITLYGIWAYFPVREFYVYGMFTCWLDAAAGLLVLVASIFDPKRRNRDAFHWFGVASYATHMVVVIARAIVSAQTRVNW